MTGHKLVRGRGVDLAVMYETHWARVLSPWERERDLQHHRLHIIRYRTGTPSQHRQINRLYLQMRIGAANRELSLSRGELLLSPGYSFVPRTLWLCSFSSSTLPAGAHLRYKPAMVSGGWVKSLIEPPRTPLQPTLTSSASSTIQDRSRSTSCHRPTPLHGAPSEDPGVSSAIILGT